tara:strand:+ start:580 stop:861 length:282 start_codon:yes stop_codon:yes gene_type:complete
MGYCKFCETKPVENWFGSFCKDCRQIKNLGNVYGFPRTLEILKKCCIRDENQLEKKISAHKEKKVRLPSIPEELITDSVDLYEKPATRKSKTK